MTSAAAAVLRRPRLWSEAMRALWAFRVRNGVLPGSELLRWRLDTAYGSPRHPVDGGDLVAFLHWRRSVRRSLGWAS